MRERINGCRINLNTATREEMDGIIGHLVTNIEVSKNQLFTVQDYYLRRFGEAAVTPDLESPSEREFELNLLDD